MAERKIISNPNIRSESGQLWASPQLIDESSEQDIIARLQAEQWQHVAGNNSRRVLHFGRKYDYNKRVDAGPAPDIPTYIQRIAEYLIQYKVMPRVDQVIINEYKPGQGISAHSDIAAYGDIIVSLSLGEACNFIFKPKADSTDRREYHLYQARRTLVVFAGMYRWQYTHEIPGRKTVDTPTGRVKKENTRISLTMRYMSD